MLHFVNADNMHQPRYAAMLEQTYRIRHDTYVDGRGWKALARPDGREIDQFDNEDANYLIWADGDEVIAGARFVPTHLPHLMSDVFPHIVTLGEIPKTPSVWELTRMFTTRGGNSKANRGLVTGDVWAGMFEMGLHFELEAISIVCDTFFVPRFLESGFKVRPLGLPTAYDEGTCVAVMLPVTYEQLTIARNNKRGTVLFEVGTRPVFDDIQTPQRIHAA